MGFPEGLENFIFVTKKYSERKLSLEISISAAIEGQRFHKSFQAHLCGQK